MRKPLERSHPIPPVRLCALLRNRRVNHMILLEEKATKEDVEETLSEEGG
jgi:hypothetical protein